MGMQSCSGMFRGWQQNGPYLCLWVLLGGEICGSQGSGSLLFAHQQAHRRADKHQEGCSEELHLHVKHLFLDENAVVQHGHLIITQSLVFQAGNI